MCSVAGLYSISLICTSALDPDADEAFDDGLEFELHATSPMHISAHTATRERRARRSRSGCMHCVRRQSNNEMTRCANDVTQSPSILAKSNVRQCSGVSCTCTVSSFGGLASAYH